MDLRSENLDEVDRLRARVADLEAALAAAQEAAHFRDAVDSMFEGMQIVDSGFRYVYLNPAAAAQGRRAREELVGTTMMAAYPGIETTEMFRRLGLCLADGVPRQMLNRFTYPDGAAGWFDLRMTPVPGGALILSVDVTPQMEVEAQLRQSREDLAATLACMGEAVIVTDADDRVRRMNPAAESLLARPLAEVAGGRLAAVAPLVDLETRVPLRVGVENGDGRHPIGVSRHAVLLRHDGTEVAVAGSAAPIGPAGDSPRGNVIVLRDMTEERALTAMLHTAQKMEAVARLAGGVAHDFNNLITVISSYGELLLEELDDDDPLKPDVEEILDAGGRAAALTRQLLAFSRKQVMKAELLDLNDVVGRMGKMLRRLIGEDVDLVVHLEPELRPVSFDPGQVEQIITNLAVNARDAMPEGGELTLQTANVELSDEYAAAHPGARAGAHVMIAVTDSGTGMDGETLARLFEPFFTTKELGRGTGLGLSTVYGIVKQGGGNVWVYSELGHGTTFKVYLPAAPGVAAPVAPRRRRSAPAAAASETILLVEDEPSVRHLFQRVLERAGYVVLPAATGAEALEWCRAHAGEIHMLLTDVVMAGMGGPEVARQALLLRPAIRVVFMSGYTDDAIVHRGVLAPGTAFIEKPMSPDAMLLKIRQFLT